MVGIEGCAKSNGNGPRCCIDRSGGSEGLKDLVLAGSRACGRRLSFGFDLAGLCFGRVWVKLGSRKGGSCCV